MCLTICLATLAFCTYIDENSWLRKPQISLSLEFQHLKFTKKDKELLNIYLYLAHKMLALLNTIIHNNF